MMSRALVVCFTLLSAASALVLPVVPVRAMRTAVRAASPLMADDCVVDAENAAEIAACADDSTPRAARPYMADDCIVQAENAAEIAACSDVSPPKTGVPIAAASVVGVPPPGGGYTSVYATRGSNPGLADFARDHSPHATALHAGLLLTRVSPALDRPYEECIVDAENATEIAACSDDGPVGGTAPPGGGYTSVPYEECIVDAENAAEIAACAE
jgi:hypothetical protein